jgi:hypothetical protein
MNKQKATLNAVLLQETMDRLKKMANVEDRSVRSMLELIINKYFEQNYTEE